MSLKIAKYADFNVEVIWDSSKPDGTLKKQLNCQRINTLGWSAKINLDEGIEETVTNFMVELKKL